jgi:hypothetical protein
MQFIQSLGLDTVLDELNRLQPGAAHTPTGLPTAGESGDKTRLTVRMAFQNKDRVQHGLERFRLSVASEAEMVPYAEVGNTFRESTAPGGTTGCTPTSCSVKPTS